MTSYPNSPPLEGAGEVFGFLKLSINKRLDIALTEVDDKLQDNEEQDELQSVRGVDVQLLQTVDMALAHAVEGKAKDDEHDP